MKYASLDDVKRVLRFTDDNPTRDAEIRASLAAIEAWADGRLDLPPQGPGVQIFYDVVEDATLHVAPNVTITKVRVYEYPGSMGVSISPIDLGFGHGFDAIDDGIILRPTLLMSPFEGAVAQRLLRRYSRVEIHYTGTGTIPRDVTEGVAFLAAGHWQDGPRALTGLTEEKIGDYSYKLGGAGDPAGQEPSYQQRANFFLTGYLKRARIAVT